MKEIKQKIDIPERGFDVKGFWVRLWELLLPVQVSIRKVFSLMLAIEVTRLAGPYVLKLIIDLITNFSVEKIPEIVILIFAMFLFNETVFMLQYIKDKR